jgi:hypothetical protein
MRRQLGTAGTSRDETADCESLATPGALNALCLHTGMGFRPLLMTATRSRESLVASEKVAIPREANRRER